MWSLEKNGTDALSLTYAVEAFEELFVSDRLWDRKRGAPRSADPQGIYRFVHDRSLRLVLDRAPYPPNVSPAVVYEPFFLARRGQGNASPYGQHRPPGGRIFLFLAQHRSARGAGGGEHRALRAGLSPAVRAGSRPRSAPGGGPPKAPGFVVTSPTRIVSSADVSHPIQVKRRTGYIPPLSARRRAAPRARSPPPGR